MEWVCPHCGTIYTERPPEPWGNATHACPIDTCIGPQYEPGDECVPGTVYDENDIEISISDWIAKQS